MTTIYRYELELTDTQVINLPANAFILDVQERFGKLMLWAQVDSDAELKPITVEIFGTGHPMALANRKFIATVQSQTDLVWHIFQRIQL